MFIIFFAIFSIIVIFLLVFLRASPSDADISPYLESARGTKGERIVAKKLHDLHPEKYKVLHDVLIATKEGSSQIDHVVISVYGVFVIETKMYNGCIHGHETSEYWTQSIYKHKTKFRNPVKQNWSHVYALKELFADFRNIPYHPIVVFAGKGVLKNVHSSIPVVYSNSIISTIKSIGVEEHCSIEQVNMMVEKLNEVMMRGREAMQEHIDTIQNSIDIQNQNIQMGVCPKCTKQNRNGNLVLKKGKYGNFLGCSNYPSCKYTVNTSTY